MKQNTWCEKTDPAFPTLRESGDEWVAGNASTLKL